MAAQPKNSIDNSQLGEGEQSPAADEATSPSETKPHRDWFAPRRLLVTLLLVLLAVAGYYVVDLAFHGWKLYQQVTALQETIGGADAQGRPITELDISSINLGELDLPILSEQMQAFSSGVDALEQRAGILAPMLRRLGWVPKIGPTVTQSPALFSAGNQGLRLASDAFMLMQPAIGDSLDLESVNLNALLEKSADSPDEFDDLAAEAEALFETLSQIDLAAVDPRIGDNLTKIEPFLPLLAPMLRLAPAAEDLLGFTEPRIYLLLVQNNHELRPTGGFLTAIGQVTVENGKIEALDFSDSYKVSRRDGEHPPAPDPLRQYMGSQLLLIRDANWSPDLPTAAQVIKSLYAADTGKLVDGMVTIDLRAAELVVNALAPLSIEGAEEPLTGETLLEQILEFWSKPLDTGDTLAEDGLNRWWGQRKDFMPKLAEAALAKVESGQVDYEKLATALLTALDERSIQIWLDNPAAMESIHQLQWGGALSPPEDGDFIALVDSNLGFNKVDYVLERSLGYRIEWPDDPGKPAKAVVTVRYEHPIEREDYKCDITPRYGDSYEDSAARCYYNYARLYAPSGSKLISINGIGAESLSQRKGEYGLSVFAGYFVMRPGESHEVSFRYLLPPELTSENYSLMIRRQAGSNYLPVTVEVGEWSLDTVVEESLFTWTPAP